MDISKDIIQSINRNLYERIIRVAGGNYQKDIDTLDNIFKQRKIVAETLLRVNSRSGIECFEFLNAQIERTLSTR